MSSAISIVHGLTWDQDRGLLSITHNIRMDNMMPTVFANYVLNTLVESLRDGVLVCVKLCDGGHNRFECFELGLKLSDLGLRYLRSCLQILLIVRGRIDHSPRVPAKLFQEGLCVTAWCSFHNNTTRLLHPSRPYRNFSPSTYPAPDPRLRCRRALFV